MQKYLILIILLAFLSNLPVLANENKRTNSPQEVIDSLCNKLDVKFNKMGWNKSGCKENTWKFFGETVKKNALIYKRYPFKSVNNVSQITLIFCGVHGDEITPVKFCFDIVSELNNLIDKNGNWKDQSMKGKNVVIAPIVSPDSFLKKYPTRTNANKIDINRNFPTKDFKKNAIKMWKQRYRSTKRKFPGFVAGSEKETKFQIYLIKNFFPTKILSVHAPLTMIDYDGPSSVTTGGELGKQANQLLISMSEDAKGYRIMNYPFFPGSLGNYAGNERGIPTYTIELPSSDNRKSKKYWGLFKDSIKSAISEDFNKNSKYVVKESIKKNIN